MASTEPRRTPLTADDLQAVTLGPLVRLDGPVELADADPEWPALYEREAVRIRGLLGPTIRLLEHVGSTSVPGLPAKPIIDVLLVVDDSADEASYAPALESGGYVLRIREPDWHEHRMFRGPDTSVNLHVFSVGNQEVERMQAFRDHLRAHPDERDRYLATKRELAARDWAFTQEYANAKSEVVEGILARAMAERRASTPPPGPR